MLITKEQQEALLNNYAKENHNYDECAGFTDGLNSMLELVSKLYKPRVVDIKYLNIPNICFSLTDKDDDREEMFSIQRKEKGFDDSETWSLTDTICRFIIPRLKRFKEVNNGTPHPFTMDEWNTVIDKILLSLELITREDGLRIWNDEESNQVEEGLDLFREWFMALLW